MTYPNDLRQAAERHYVDGKDLQDKKRFANAGYHFGFAAECAIKQFLIEQRIPTTEPTYWEHFPTLRTLALTTLKSRKAAKLSCLLGSANFFQEWDITMRYAGNTAITPERAEKWRDQANKTIAATLLL